MRLGCWVRLFCLVWPRCREWRDLWPNVERCSAGALVIWFVVVRGGGGSHTDGKEGVRTRAGDGGKIAAAVAVAGVGAGRADGGVRVNNAGGAVKVAFAFAVVAVAFAVSVVGVGGADDVDEASVVVDGVVAVVVGEMRRRAGGVGGEWM